MAWESLWTQRGLRQLKRLALPESDRLLLDLKLKDLEGIEALRLAVEARMQEVYAQWPEAQRVDAVRAGSAW